MITKPRIAIVGVRTRPYERPGRYIPPMPPFNMIAKGTACAALDASSAIWILGGGWSALRQRPTSRPSHDTYTAVEARNRPNGRQPSEYEGPPRWPAGEVLDLGKDEIAVVALALAADGQGDNGGKDKDQVEYGSDGLQAAHELGHGRDHKPLHQEGGKGDGIDDAIGRRPCTVGRDSDSGHASAGHAASQFR